MDELLKLLLGPSGMAVLALVLLVTGWKKMWVFGWYARQIEKERDEWKAMALRGAKLAETVATVTETVIRDNGPS